MYFLCFFFCNQKESQRNFQLYFLNSSKNYKLNLFTPKEKKEKTCCCLERSNERSLNGCCRHFVCTLTRARGKYIKLVVYIYFWKCIYVRSTYVHTPAEQGRSYYNLDRVANGNNRSRKSVGSADEHPFNQGAQSAQ